MAYRNSVFTNIVSFNFLLGFCAHFTGEEMGLERLSNKSLVTGGGRF